ncbi:MAG: sigma factor [Nocardioides sp.]
MGGATEQERAFHEFVAARGRVLARTAYLLTGDHHLAEDLLQTALFQTARYWDRIHGSPESYARRILYHQNISWWRRKRWQESPSWSTTPPHPTATRTCG